MAKVYIGGTYDVPQAETTLATITGYAADMVFDGTIVALTANGAENIIVKRTTANGADTTLAAGASLPRKICTFGSITLSSTSGAGHIVLDATTVEHGYRIYA